MREIDALDGLTRRVADKAGIQFRVLNRSNGQRPQVSHKLFRAAMRAGSIFARDGQSHATTEMRRNSPTFCSLATERKA